MPVEADIPKTLTPQIAVACVVAQLADTVAGISRRLRQLFPAAQFPESTVHNNTKSLAKDGYLRLLERGSGPAQHRYEATDEGKEFARLWRLRSGIPPQTRDPLLGRLAFSEGAEEVRAQIALALEEEHEFKAQHDEVYRRAQSQKHHRDAQAGIDCRAELDAIKLKNEYELLMTLSRRCQKVRTELEDLLARLEVG